MYQDKLRVKLALNVKMKVETSYFKRVFTSFCRLQRNFSYYMNVTLTQSFSPTKMGLPCHAAAVRPPAEQVGTCSNPSPRYGNDMFEGHPNGRGEGGVRE